MMRLLLILLTSFVFSSLFAQTMDNRGYVVQKGELSPKFEIELLSGDTLSNQSLLGQVVVLQFTASWCSVCRKEMPHLESEVWQKFKDDAFLLVGIDLKEDEATTLEFAAKMGVTYPMASDLEGRLFSLFAGPKQGVTRNIVINKKGEIVFLTRLYDRVEFEQMIEIIAQELEK